MPIAFKRAPELITSRWFNTEKPVTLAGLRGRVVLIEAFQMLCPGCVSHALPQAQTIHKTFNPEDVAVIGLHTVFEHHEAMTPTALEAFLHEYRIEFPVGVDTPSDPPAIPRTMALYHMQGTPTTILLDRKGRIRKMKFGRETDLVMGAEVMSLVMEAAQETKDPGNEIPAGKSDPAEQCDENGCPVS